MEDENIPNVSTDTNSMTASCVDTLISKFPPQFPGGWLTSRQELASPTFYVVRLQLVYDTERLDRVVT